MVRDRGRTLSIVIPALDEAPAIEAALARLEEARGRGVEVILVDGGSTDGTPQRAAAWVDAIVSAPRGRASQMNAGAARARGDTLLFLHADCEVPRDVDRIVQSAVGGEALAWGRFDVEITGKSTWLRVIGASMNVRSRISGIATGDQGIFLTRTLFERVGGFPAIALMEDVALSKAAKRVVPPKCLRAKIVTSGRRWERHGIIRTIMLMWRLRLAYFLGADPRELAVRYGRGR